jgi:recombination protein RecR
MSPAFDKLQKVLRRLPGLGFRSAERLALHLVVEKPESVAELIDALQAASTAVRRCSCCGNLAEQDLCAICRDDTRDARIVCIVERVPDLVAMERSGAYRGRYHVLHGKLSPLNGVGPEHLNLAALDKRMEEGGISELILALSNDLESEATCHFLQSRYSGRGVLITRIGFGLPSGGGPGLADATTLRSALDGRRHLPGN